jgi:glutamine amidotransferase
VAPADPGDSLADSEYGGQRFCAVIARRNVLGCQFHPETSAQAGLAIFRNFATRIATGAPEQGAAPVQGGHA